MSNEAKTDELCHCPRYSTAHAPQPACSKTKPEAATGETRPAEATNPLVEDEATTTLVAETAEPVDNGRGPTSDWRSCIDVHPAADLLHQRQTHALKVGSLVIQQLRHSDLRCSIECANMSKGHMRSLEEPPHSCGDTLI
jgi:hypothetical protein